MKRPQITAIASSGKFIVLSWTPPTTSSKIISYVVDYVFDSKRHRVEQVLTTTFRISAPVEGLYTFTVSSRTATSQSPASLPVRINHVLPIEVPVEVSPPQPAIATPEKVNATPSSDAAIPPAPTSLPPVAEAIPAAVQQDAPSVPTGISVRPLSATSATVRWDPMFNVKAFVLKIKSSVPGSKVGRLTIPGSESTVDIDDLEIGASYTFSLTADGSASSDAYTYTLAKRAPSRPLNLRVENDFTLRWDAPEDTSGLPISYAVSNGATTIYNITEERYDMPNESMNRPVTISVVASNAYGDSPASPPLTHIFRRSTGLEVPGPPKNVTTRSGRQAVSLRWQKPTRDGNSPVTRYTVSWESEIGGGTMDALSTEAIVSDLKTGVLYTFEILATNAIGSSVPAIVTAMPSDIPAKAPHGLVAKRLSDTRARLEWSAPDGIAPESIDSYTIDMKSTIHYGTLSMIKTTSVDVNLKRNTTYEFAVAAENAAGLGPFSSIVKL